MVAIAVALLSFAGAARASTFPLLRPEEPAARSCALAIPAGWQQPAFDDKTWTRGLDPSGCDVLRLRRRFDLADPSRVVTLALTVRYQDGFVAWINGVAVARRRYDDGAAVATEPHGAESEHFVVAVTPGLLRPGANMLAIEVHPFRAGRLPAAEATLDGSDGVRIVRGPYLTSVTESEAHLAFETDLPTRADIHWTTVDAGAKKEHTLADAAPSTRHLMRLDGLQPGRAYHYRLTARSAEGPPSTAEADFHTPPTATLPLRFIVTGDTRSGHFIHEQVVKAIMAEDPDLVLMTGDLVATGSDEAEWQHFFEIEAPLVRQVPIYSAVGNHEYWRNSDGLKRFLEVFDRAAGTTWWSFDEAGVHFILLDSQAYRDPAQIAWLKKDLAEAVKRNPRAIFACTHHGPWSAGFHGDNPDAIRDYAPLLEAAHATAILSGHDHHYERGQVGGLAYVVSGGGGAELRAARCGIPGKRKCSPHVAAFINDHHFVVVEVRAATVRLCPRRVDGTPLEPCFTLPGRP